MTDVVEINSTHFVVPFAVDRATDGLLSVAGKHPELAFAGVMALDEPLHLCPL